MTKITIATRKSDLAMWQARHVESLLRRTHPGIEVELLPMVTRGDIILDRPLATIGGKGLFLKELEKALLSGEADIAVHSMKDVPVEDAPGLEVKVLLERANPFDALLNLAGRTLEELTPGARVGTSSLRRQCQLRALRPDLEVADLRGNVNTRIRKLEEGDYDAIILACAGLERLGLERYISQVLQPPRWLPAGTQGTIGIQNRAGDERVRELLEPLGDPAATLRTRAERAVATSLHGSCQVPLAVYATLEGGRLALSGLVGTPDGATLLRSDHEGPAEAVDDIAKAVTRELVSQGAADIIAALGDTASR